ncbi:MAG TPA: Ig-like domain-containing protein [Gammaproteobacteria bacterium]
MIQVKQNPFRKFLKLLSAAALSLAAFAGHAATSSQAPGGFIEKDEATVTRSAMTASQITGFLPSRGSFTFPAPYGTQGVRITNSSDCGGQDCLDMTYNYWKNMSNSAGSDVMYILVGLDKQRGGEGPTLFKFTKSTGALAKVGPLFAASSVLSKQSTEGWYFSYSMPTTIYLHQQSKLERYDVLSHQLTTVFDSTTKYPGTIIAQTNSSNDDDVHSATLENATTYAKEGCVVYQSSTKKFWLFPTVKAFDECQVDKSGRYVEVKQKLTQDTCTSCDEDDTIIDLQTGKQQVLLDKDGAGGHSDLGYGTMVASDNWNTQPNAWRVWNLADLVDGKLVYHGGTWGSFAPSHISWSNASASAPLAQQYVCGGAAVSGSDVTGNEVRCFTLDGSVASADEQSLVVAPVMTDVNAAGGDAECPSCTDYGKDPKGNLDPTGEYFFWTSNMGGGRLDAFMVRVPSQLLTGGASSDGVAITSPTNGATVNGALTVTASVGNMQVAGVTFEVDGGDATTAMDAPYKASWPAGSLTAGPHTLTAVATGTDGSTQSAAPVNIQVDSAGNVTTGASGGGGGGGGSVSLVGLVLFGFLGLWRRLARSLRDQDALA